MRPGLFAAADNFKWSTNASLISERVSSVVLSMARYSPNQVSTKVFPPSLSQSRSSLSSTLITEVKKRLPAAL